MLDLLYHAVCGIAAAGTVWFGLSAVMPLCRTEGEQAGRNFACGAAGLGAAALVGLVA